MTMIDFYPPGWMQAQQTEQSSHASDGLEATSEARVSAPRLDLPVTEQEDEAWDRLTRLAGIAE